MMKLTTFAWLWNGHLATDVESGLRIAAFPWRFWEAHGYLREMGEWLAQLLERYPTTDSLHAQALAVYSICLFRQGNFAETIQIAEHSLQMARALSDEKTEAFSLFSLAYSLSFTAAWRERATSGASLALYRALGDKIGQATTMEALSINPVIWSARLLLPGKACDSIAR